MNGFVILHAALSLAALPPAPLPPMAVDTPPPPLTRLSSLKTMADVVGVTVLADGRPAPVELVLPQIQNRRQTLEYMRVHYPEALRDSVSKGMPIAWVFVDDHGKVADAKLLSTSGYPALDSLALRVLGIADFKPARHGDRAVGVWTPFPARIPPLGELMAALKAADQLRSEAPVETPYTQKPVLLNRNQVEAAIIRVIATRNRMIAEMNEAFARSQRVGGDVQMWVYIDATGAVANAIVKKTSGNLELDNAAQNIVRIMRFSPARNGSEAVDVWIEVPIKFKAG